MEITKKAREKAQRKIDNERIEEKPSSVDEIICEVENSIVHIPKKYRHHLVVSNHRSVLKAYAFTKNYMKWQVYFNKKGVINKIDISRAQARPVGEESYIYVRIKDIEKIIPNYYKLSLEEKSIIKNAVTYKLTTQGSLL